jgi:hypothetical protein
MGKTELMFAGKATAPDHLRPERIDYEKPELNPCCFVCMFGERRPAKCGQDDWLSRPYKSLLLFSKEL